MKIEGTEEEFKYYFNVGYQTINKGDYRILEVEGKKLHVVFTNVEQSGESISTGIQGTRIYNHNPVKLTAEVV